VTPYVLDGLYRELTARAGVRIGFVGSTSWSGLPTANAPFRSGGRRRTRPAMSSRRLCRLTRSFRRPWLRCSGSSPQLPGGSICFCVSLPTPVRGEARCLLCSGRTSTLELARRDPSLGLPYAASGLVVTEARRSQKGTAALVSGVGRAATHCVPSRTGAGRCGERASCAAVGVSARMAA